MSHWDTYYKLVGEKPHPFVLRTVSRYTSLHGAALDLGAGNMRNANYLASNGFSRVDAVDREVDAAKYARLDVSVAISSLEEYVPTPNTYDLIICIQTLYFLSREKAERVIRQSIGALRPGGIFAAQVLGVRDKRFKGEGNPQTNAFLQEGIYRLLHGVDILELEQDEGPVNLILIKGTHHKHEWRFVLQKPSK